MTRTFAIALLAGVGAVATSGAVRAADTLSSGTDPGLVQQVRMVCDPGGRCYQMHHGRRVVPDSYAYGPRERYGRRAHREYDEPRAGAGIHAPGVSVGVGRY